MSVHTEVVLVVQTRGRLDDAETLVTGIESHVSSPSEFSTCEKNLAFKFNVFNGSLSSQYFSHIKHQTNFKL